MSKDKSKHGRDRTNETLFIDAKNLGTMETRKLRVFTDEDIQKIQNIVSAWRKGDRYEDVEGYCKSSNTEEIEKNGYVLTPGRYVGFADEEDDGVSFKEKIERLTLLLKQQKDESEKLDQEIHKNLKKLGYE